MPRIEIYTSQDPHLSEAMRQAKLLLLHPQSDYEPNHSLYDPKSRWPLVEKIGALGFGLIAGCCLIVLAFKAPLYYTNLVKSGLLIPKKD